MGSSQPGGTPKKRSRVPPETAVAGPSRASSSTSWSPASSTARANRPTRHSLATAALSRAARFPPYPYPSETGDRRSQAILRPVDPPKSHQKARQTAPEPDRGGQGQVSVPALRPARYASQSFMSRRRSNRSVRRYAASTLFRTACASAASMTSRGWSVFSAAQSRNDDRNPMSGSARAPVDELVRSSSATRGPTRTGSGRLSRRTGRLAPRPISRNRFLEIPQVQVGLGRFELPTSRLSGVRSNQLSYRPRCQIMSHERRGWGSTGRTPRGCHVAVRSATGLAPRKVPGSARSLPRQ